MATRCEGVAEAGAQQQPPPLQLVNPTVPFPPGPPPVLPNEYSAATPDHEPEEYSPSSPSLGPQFAQRLAEERKQRQQQDEERLRQQQRQQEEEERLRQQQLEQEKEKLRQQQLQQQEKEILRQQQLEQEKEKLRQQHLQQQEERSQQQQQEEMRGQHLQQQQQPFQQQKPQEERQWQRQHPPPPCPLQHPPCIQRQQHLTKQEMEQKTGFPDLTPPPPSSPLPNKDSVRSSHEQQATWQQEENMTVPWNQDLPQPSSKTGTIVAPIKGKGENTKIGKPLDVDAMFANFLSEIDECSSTASNKEQSVPTDKNLVRARADPDLEGMPFLPDSTRQEREDLREKEFLLVDPAYVDVDRGTKRKHLSPDASYPISKQSPKEPATNNLLEAENKALAERNKELKLIIDHLEKNLKHAEKKKKSRMSVEFLKEKNKDLQLIVDHLEKDLKVKADRCESLEKDNEVLKERVANGKHELKALRRSFKEADERKKVSEARIQRLVAKLELMEQELSEAVEKSALLERNKATVMIKKEEPSPTSPVPLDSQKLFEELQFYKDQAAEAVDTAERISADKDAAIFGLEMQLNRSQAARQTQSVVLKGAVMIDQTRVKRTFDGYGVCEGTVVGFENKQFHILYDDGDSEPMFLEDLMKWVQPDTLGKGDEGTKQLEVRAKEEALKEEVQFWKQRAFSARQEANATTSKSNSDRHVLCARLENLKAHHTKREENLMQKKETERISLEKYYSAKTETIEEEMKQLEQEKATIESENKNLKSQIDGFKKAMAEKEKELKQQAQLMDKKLCDLKTKLVVKEAEVKRLAAKTKELESNMQSLKVELDVKDSELERQAEVAAQLTESTLSKHEDLAKELGVKKAELKAEKRLSERLTKELKEKKSELVAKTNVASQVPGLQKKLKASHVEREALESRRLSEAATLHERLETKEEEHASQLAEALSLHEAQVATLEEQAREQVAKLREDHQVEVACLAAKLKQTQKKAEEAQREREKLEDLSLAPYSTMTPEQAEQFGIRWELLNVYRQNMLSLLKEIERHKKATKKKELPCPKTIVQKIDVNREQVAREVFLSTSFFHRNSDIKSVFYPLHVTFVGSGGIFDPHQEDGEDEGGLTNEFYTLFFEQLEDVKIYVKNNQFEGKRDANHEVKLFERVSRESLTILPTKFCDEDGKPHALSTNLQKKYELFGRMLLRAILHDQVVPSRFASSLLMDYCLGFERRSTKKSYRQMQKELTDIDPQYQWVLTQLDAAIEAASSSQLTFGDVLVSNDRRRIHDKNTAKECLSKFIFNQIIEPREEQFKHIINGFSSQAEINFTPFLEICSYQEMQLLICGYEEFDADSIMNCLSFKGFHREEEKCIGYFKEALRSMSPKQLVGFLRFATGLSALPAGGAATLEISVVPLCHDQDGVHGPRKTEGYPISHTCVKEVEIPIYSSQTELQQKLFEAIRSEHCRFTTR